MDWIRDYGVALLFHVTNLALLLTAFQVKAQIGTSSLREAIMSIVSEVVCYFVAVTYSIAAGAAVTVWALQCRYASKTRRPSKKSQVYVV